MNFSRKGLLLAAVQVLLVASLGAKLELDRSRLPRVWVKTAAVDPYLPIRGRYLAVRLTVQVPHPPETDSRGSVAFFAANLSVRNGQLVAEGKGAGATDGVWVTRSNRNSEYALQQAVLFFLPEHGLDPLVAARNGELWAEVTVPARGLPRPIRLAVKRGDSFTPLEAK
jgi:hypothetical protein